MLRRRTAANLRSQTANGCFAPGAANAAELPLFIQAQISAQSPTFALTSGSLKQKTALRVICKTDRPQSDIVLKGDVGSCNGLRQFTESKCCKGSRVPDAAKCRSAGGADYAKSDMEQPVARTRFAAHAAYVFASGM